MEVKMNFITGKTDKWVLEYSKSQNAYHIQTHDEHLMSEMTCIERGHKSDWKIIGTFNTRKEAQSYRKEIY